MPSSKRRKTGLRDSGIFLDSDSDSSAVASPTPLRKNREALSETSGNIRSKRASPAPKKERQGAENQNVDASSKSEIAEDDVAPYTYICFHRPFFDYDGENWLDWSNGKAERLNKSELMRQVYTPGCSMEEAEGIVSARALASEHKDHKWVMMQASWMRYRLLTRRGKCCDPSTFDTMLLDKNWHGYGMQEIVENTLIQFDMAFNKKDRDEMWSLISALGFWLSDVDNITAVINTNDGKGCCQIVSLIGCACLTALHAVEAAGELKPDSRFLDLPLVISYYLELSHDLPAYGIEGTCISWRKELVAYFKRGNLDPNKGMFATQLRLDELANAPDYDGITDDEHVDKEKVSPPPLLNKKRKHEDTQESSFDKWHWTKAFTIYTLRRGRIGGRQHDITKLTRAERAAATCNGKDPLAHLPAKELKQNLSDLE